MKDTRLTASRHFDVEELADGVFACIHKPGGGAYSNAGIVDLGGQTIVVDAFDTMAAGQDLRQAAESLSGRPVDYLVLTHPHSDHWIGASRFDQATQYIASKESRRVTRSEGRELVREIEEPAAWQEEIEQLEQQVQEEKDPRVLVGLENTLVRYRHAFAEMANFQPRYPDQTFTEPLSFQGSQRTAELRSMGRGHSADDAVLFLPQDGVAFIGDIGFFDSQPYLGSCDLDLHKQQLHFFLDSQYQVLVPGHGPVGGKEDIHLQLDYLAVMENLVGEVVQGGGSLQDAQKITFPEPFDRWLIGGMGRFEINVKVFYRYLGGKT